MAFVLQNVVFPVDRDPDLLPLYTDPEIWSVIDRVSVRVSERAHLGNVLDRHRARVAAGRRVSFAAYFNAFPASYWQHWTSIRSVTLRVRTTGPATILVYRSTAEGTRQRLESREVERSAESTFDIPLNHYSAGGWIWFDIVADEKDTIFEGAEWTTEDEPVRDGKASIGITTYNKPDYCISTLQTLADSPGVLELIDRIFVVDQGEQRVDGEPEFAELAAHLGDTLQMVTQANLGGSGGFSRAMLEALDRPESEFIQLLDDDVRIEPEAVRRSVMFARYARTPTIVGGHMFDLLDRPKLHAWAEVVDTEPFMWRALNAEDLPHDFTVKNLRQTPMMHQRQDADYNGFWMCLIPTAVVREIGLTLPAFIKWDDAEFCLRARSAGFPTVSLPGVALWHVSWVGKDDQIDWQAYFHARNRIVAALLHSKHPGGGTLLRHSRRADIKHLVSMQYYPVVLRHRAIRDILSGPAHMRGSLESAMPEARRLSAGFPETTVHLDEGVPMHSRRGRRVPNTSQDAMRMPSGPRILAMTAAAVMSHWIRRPDPENVAVPEVELVKSDSQWWRIWTFDSALVGTADGAGANAYVRDRTQFRRLLRDSIALHSRLRREWPRLAQQYRAADGDLTSIDAWRRTFGASK